MSKPSNPGKRQNQEWVKHAVVLGILLLELVPFYMMAQISLKDNQSFLANPWLPNAPANWQWDNYLYALKLIVPYVANTVFVTVLAVGGGLACAIAGAYFFARCKAPFKEWIFAMFLFLMIMPSVANIVPLFNLLKDLSLLNTLWALIIVGIAGAQAFNIFVLRSFIEDLPKDLFDAAQVDGASHFQQIRHLVLPMCGSIIGTLAILMFIAEWNDYMLPLIVLRDKDLFTLGVGLISLDGEYVKRWGHMMAAYVIASIPLIILFAFTMKLFIRGLASGALKG